LSAFFLPLKKPQNKTLPKKSTKTCPLFCVCPHFWLGAAAPKKRDKNTAPSVFIYRGGRADLALFAESGRCGFWGVFVRVFVISRLEKADKTGGVPAGIEKRLQRGRTSPLPEKKTAKRAMPAHCP